MDYKNPVCRGSFLLGTACGECERCRDEMKRFCFTENSTVYSSLMVVNALEARENKIATLEAEKAELVEAVKVKDAEIARLMRVLLGENWKLHIFNAYGGYERIDCAICRAWAKPEDEVKHKPDCPLYERGGE